MLCALHTYYPWALDLFIQGPFQLLFLENAALAAISALGTSRTHCHLCPIRYSLTPESSEACEGNLPNDTTSKSFPNIERRETWYYQNILHQAWFETARQEVTLAKIRALTIAPRPSLCSPLHLWWESIQHQGVINGWLCRINGVHH